MGSPEEQESVSFIHRNDQGLNNSRDYKKLGLKLDHENRCATSFYPAIGLLISGRDLNRLLIGFEQLFIVLYMHDAAQNSDYVFLYVCCRVYCTLLQDQ